MKRLLASILLAASLLAGAGNMVKPVAADHCLVFGCDDKTYGEYTQYNQPLQELRQTAVYRWTYVQEGNTNLHDSIANTIAECAAKLGFVAQEVSAGANGWRQISSGGMDFIYGNAKHEAGGSWAIGIVSGFLDSTSAAVYDADTMSPWGEDSKDEVVGHETCGHTISGLGEGYQEDYVYGSTACAPTDGGPGVSANVPVRGFHNSMMNCGLQNNQHVDAFMVGAFQYVHYPPPATAVGATLNYVGGPSVWACGLQPKTTRQAGVKTAAATRIAVIYWTPSQGNFFSGRRPAYAPDSNGCQGIFIDPPIAEERWCGIKPESELSFARDFNEVWVRC